MAYTSGKHVCTLPRELSCRTMSPTAGFIRRQMCKIRQLMLASAWHHGTALFIPSHKSLVLEQQRQLNHSHWLVCHPYSAIKFYWDCWILFLTSAVFVYMPLQVFYPCPDPYDPFILFCDAISALDMVMHFFTGYVDEDNRMIILSLRSIALYRLRTTFIFEVAGCLPLQLIHLFDDCHYPTHTVFFLVKLCRLVTLYGKWQSLLSQLGLSYVAKVALTVLVHVMRFFHWMTYIHYQVPALCVHYYEMDRKMMSWLKKFNVVNIQMNSVFQKYTTNLFLVCGLCIGAGYYSPLDKHLIPQMLLTAATSLIGLMFLTYSFTTLLRLVIYSQFEMYLFNGRYKELEEYMIFKRLPKFLQRKIKLFINYKFNGHYFNEASIMNTLNEQIKQDINMYSCKFLVMNVPLFQDLPIALINTIIFSMMQILYMPGETVVSYGQPGSSIFLISSGTVAVMDSGGKEVAHLRDGAFFGETCLLRPGTARTASIVALEITEVYTLNSKDLQACLQPYPHLKRRLEESVDRRRGTPSKSRSFHGISGS